MPIDTTTNTGTGKNWQRTQTLAGLHGQVTGGHPPWGDIAVVFNTSKVSDMVVYPAIDSGDYACACDTNFTSHFCGEWRNETACKEFWYCKWGPQGGTYSDHGRPRGRPAAALLIGERGR